MQQEIDLNLIRLNEINRQKQALNHYARPDQHNPQPGSVVHTNNGNYYIAISAGQLKAGIQVLLRPRILPIGEKMIAQKDGVPVYAEWEELCN